MVRLSSPPSRRGGRQNGPAARSYIVILLGVCCLGTVLMNILHSSIIHNVSIEAMEAFAAQHLLTADSPIGLKTGGEQPTKTQDNSKPQHKLSGLNCDAYGGPSEEIAQEMVYWSDIPSDSEYISPFHPKPGERPRYMTFEPDGGGWNNIRMSMETVLAMAHAMGRTLVLPPEQRMYLLGAGQGKEGKKQRKDFSFSDFFHMDSIANEHAGLEIISMEEFLKREGLTGQLRERTTGQVLYPPQNRTDWNGKSDDVNTMLNPFIRKTAYPTDWDPDECMAAFPASSDPKDIETLHNIKKDIEDHGGFPGHKQFIGKPHPVDASPTDRMKENCAARNQLCIYDEEMQKELVVHFAGKYKLGARLLVHFYAFLFFEDWKQDLWMKRFIRDHVRYVDEIQCAAARVVHAIRERAKSRQPDKNPEGYFDSFHIRRGDFQYTVTRFDADKIYNISKKELIEGATVYIGTDERDKSFFKPLADRYDVVFLDDFKDVLQDLNTNYYGMLDQLVASRGRIFFGCWFSTFTGYINRMRGYHVDKLKLPGHEDGIVPSYYYALEDRKYHMQEFWPVKKVWHAREFPASWRDIDKGIGLLH